MDANSGFVIVVEGCDRTGKTTLCDQLSNFLKWPVVKFSQPKVDAMAEYTEALAEHPESFIADRLHLGESVYGPIYRGTPPVLRSRVLAFEGDLVGRGALLVLLTDTPLRVRDRFAQLGEDFAKPDHVVEILERFDHEFGFSALSKVRMNMATGTQFEKVVVIAAVARYIWEAR